MRKKNTARVITINCNISNSHCYLWVRLTVCFVHLHTHTHSYITYIWRPGQHSIYKYFTTRRLNHIAHTKYTHRKSNNKNNIQNMNEKTKNKNDRQTEQTNERDMLTASRYFESVIIIRVITIHAFATRSFTLTVYTFSYRDCVVIRPLKIYSSLSALFLCAPAHEQKFC